jgi:DNA-binding LacI/PurR family transcriptional regulator
MLSPVSARAATMNDVAQRAGVSQQTVSRVVNKSGYVGTSTRERVHAAMRDLGYRPNAAAKALVTGRSNTLGVVTLDTVAHGPASVLQGLDRAARAHGYRVSVARLDSLDGAALLNAVEELQRQRVEGVLLNAGPQGMARRLDPAQLSVPLVAFEEPGDAGVPVVHVDEFAGARAATALLLDLGHRTVTHIAGPRDWASTHNRSGGWRAALESAGAEVPPALYGDWSLASGYDLGRRLADDRGLTAIFAANDEMALGAMRALVEAGRALPQEVSVVGFDDVPFARYLTPSLTTVRQDFDAIGRRGVQLLLDAIAGAEDAPVRAVVTPELIMRESTTPAAVRA